MQPLRTTSSKQIIEALDEQLYRARELVQDEASTYERQVWNVRINTIEVCRAIVRGLLPYVEVDAVQLVVPNTGMTAAERMLDGTEPITDDATDPSLPFVRAVA